MTAQETKRIELRMDKIENKLEEGFDRISEELKTEREYNEKKFVSQAEYVATTKATDRLIRLVIPLVGIGVTIAIAILSS